jgi:hypothetical protein
MRKLRSLLLLGAVMLEVGCGLPDSYYLQPPSVTTLASLASNTFSFKNPVHDIYHDINVIFSGDELYYKLYANPAEVEVNAYDNSNSADPSTQLTEKGFWPVCLGADQVGSRSDPVIPEAGTAASGSSVTVTINSSGTSYYVLDSNAPVEIRRDVANTSLPTQYKTFESSTSSGNGYFSSDADFASVSADPQLNGTTIYVAWYVISYGLTNTSTPSRSSAVYLGYMSLSYS